ncbi:MAG: shikimate kinase [Candidatus Merdivicinus sp.]|jgi:shikimate kinase
MDFKENIVLIGMPGSGKTTVGRHLAQLTGMIFLDLDTEIERTAGMDIPRIFSEKGEDTFRQIETDCARKASRLSGYVIACGGGIILRQENMRALGRTGTIVFLDRSVKEICASKLDGRPLIAGNLDRVQALYDQRIALYRQYAEVTVESSRSPEFVARLVWESLQGQEGVQ